MAQPQVWFTGSDMLVQLDALRSSTMASGTYLNNSGGVTAQVWNALSTSNGNNLVLTGTLTYVTGSNGNYRLTVQSTDYGPTKGTRGMVITKVSHAGMNREWRTPFRVDWDRS